MALFHCNFFSYTLHRMMDLNVVIPSVTFGESMGEHPQVERHQTDDKYPVLYLLHGTGGDFSVWNRYTGLERYAEARSIAVVTLSAENKFYANRPGGSPFGDRFYDFMEKEIPDFLAAFFPILSQKREDTFIAGLSMGGYGALMHAMGSPERFAAVGAFSPGLMATEHFGDLKGMTDERFDLIKMLPEYKDKMADMPKAYVCCGEDDGLFAVSKKYAELYKNLGGEVEWHSLPGYKHEWAFWDIELQRFLDWLPRKDGLQTRVRDV